MDGPRVHHTKWSKADRERQIWYHLKRRNDTNALIYLKEIKYGFQRGKVRG